VAKEMLAMKRTTMLTIATAAVALAALGGAGVSAQDAAKYSFKVPDGLKVPGGLAFAEGKGYEDWAVIASHHTDDLVEAIVGNPVAMKAFRAGIPDNGKPFPDGSKMAKLMWSSKRNLVSPHHVKVPGAMVGVEFMVKDAKRFADSGGWGYAVFYTDAASGTYRSGTLTDNPPQGNDAKCGAACHTIVKARDSVFTEYGKR
jgi:Cytochrome P460